MTRPLLLLTLTVATLEALAADFAGTQACAECHAREYLLHRTSHHALALRRAGQSDMAQYFDNKAIRERTGIGLDYRVTGHTIALRITSPTAPANQPLEAQIEWAFGGGSKAFTPVGRLSDGTYFEHRLSWYESAKRLALTAGHPGIPAKDAASALGLLQKPATITRCFNCHATNVRESPEGPDLSAATPGIQCERCHGPAAKHVEVARATPPNPTAIKRSILNAGRFNAKNIVLTCAECHRSPEAETASASPEMDNMATIRFSPVGFLASKCFQKSGKFACTTCHNPHESVRPANSDHYKKICLSCHTSKPATAPAAATKRAPRCRRLTDPTQNCIACHMKQDSPLPFLSFTDHRIRIYPE